MYIYISMYAYIQIQFVSTCTMCKMLSLKSISLHVSYNDEKYLVRYFLALPNLCCYKPY